MANVLAVRKADQERRENEARERIRAEEQAKAEREARAKLAAEEAERIALQATPAPTAAPVAPAPAYRGGQDAFDDWRQGGPVANVVPMPTRAPAVDTSARIKLGELNARIAPLSITADGLESLGFPVVETDKNAKLYRLADVPQILAAMALHIQAVQEKAAA
jgi:hypothetical protein